MTTKKPSSIENEILAQIRWVIRLRWVSVGAVLLAALLIRIYFPYQIEKPLIVGVLVSGYNSLAFYHYKFYLESRENTLRASQTNLEVQLLLDIFFIAYSIYITGGVCSKFLYFYLVHIPLLGLVLSKKTLVRHTALIIFILSAMFWLEYLQIIPHRELQASKYGITYYLDLNFIFNTWAFMALAVFLTTFITNYIREQFIVLLQEKDKALKDSENLKKFAVSLSSTLQWQETADGVLKNIRDLIPYDIAALILLENNIATIIAGQAIPKKLLNKIIPIDQWNHYNDLLWEKESIIENTCDRRYCFWHLLKTPHIIHSIHTPIIFNAEIIGFLAVGRKSDQAYTQKDTELIQSLAQYTASALQKSQRYENIRQQAFTDGLTGLNNRRALEYHLEKEARRAERYKLSYSILMCDLDKFKDYNDTYGHLAGDDLLRELANIMITSTRKSDMVFRYGGEEFIFLLPETKQAEAQILAERLRQRVAKHSFIVKETDTATSITISIGVATYPQGAHSAQALINAADKALYKAKETRNRCVCYFQIQNTIPHPR